MAKILNKATKTTQKNTNYSNEFKKLRNLALELKDMQLQILKDLNKKEFIK